MFHVTEYFCSAEKLSLSLRILAASFTNVRITPCIFTLKPLVKTQHDHGECAAVFCRMVLLSLWQRIIPSIPAFRQSPPLFQASGKMIMLTIPINIIALPQAMQAQTRRLRTALGFRGRYALTIEGLSVGSLTMRGRSLFSSDPRALLKKSDDNVRQLR